MKSQKVVIKLTAILLIATTLLAAGTMLATANEDPIEQFVTRLYKNVLDRDPDKSGFTEWVKQLKAGTTTGAGAAKGFFLSDEFIKRGLDDEEFLTTLYTTLMDRRPDSGGFSHWIMQLECGLPRASVLEGFVNSTEYTGICDRYGIKRGEYKAPDYNKAAVAAKVAQQKLLNDYIAEVLRLVNKERDKLGVKALSGSDTLLNKAVKIRAKEIIIDFSHTRPDGESCHTAYSDAGGKFTSFGENIALGQKTPEEVVDTWMNSPDHRANIVHSNFTHIGIGAVYNDFGVISWVQLFKG